MNTQDFSKFRHESIHALKRLNEANERGFRISSWPRYDYDLDHGTLTFSQDGVPKVVASILVAGTTSESGGTWLWSWGNVYLPDGVSEPLKKVRDFGIAENIPELTEPYAPDDEYVGWAMTAVAARILGAKGAYRCPGNNGFVYLIFTDIAFAELATPHEKRQPITCSTHGAAYATYICEHLLENPQQQWFSSEPNEENPWPDSWCATCDVFFQEQGEWNQRNENKMKIELLCHLCYEAFRGKSTIYRH